LARAERGEIKHVPSLPLEARTDITIVAGWQPEFNATQMKRWQKLRTRQARAIKAGKEPSRP